MDLSILKICIFGCFKSRCSGDSGLAGCFLDDFAPCSFPAFPPRSAVCPDAGLCRFRFILSTWDKPMVYVSCSCFPTTHALPGWGNKCQPRLFLILNNKSSFCSGYIHYIIWHKGKRAYCPTAFRASAN